MNGIERLMAALAGAPADRIPVFCNLIDQGARELGVPIREYLSRGDLVAEAQCRMRARYGYDNVWSLFYVGKEAELLGSTEMIFADDGPPNVSDFVIRNWDDVGNLQVPDRIEDHPAFEEPSRCLKLLSEEVGGEYPICAYVTSTMSLPILLMGMERWFELLFTGPDDAHDTLLEKCFELFCKEVGTYRNAGADVIVYSNPFGSTDTVSARYFEEFCLPWIERELSEVGADGMVYYCGTSRFNRLLPLLLEKTQFPVYYISPLDDISEAVDIIADRALVCGVINDIKLLEWSPEETREEVARLVAAGMRSRKFLFGTGVMPYNIPEENIETMLRTAYASGRR